VTARQHERDECWYGATVLHSIAVENSRYLVQMLLPVYDNDGRPFSEAMFAGVRRELTDRFGGVTAYLRAPARGAWKTGDGDEARDDIVIVEVMTQDLDRDWWSTYRQRLEAQLHQDAIVVRAMALTIL
jgi:hypothetical protein